MMAAMLEPAIGSHTPEGMGTEPTVDEPAVTIRQVSKRYQLYARPQDRLKHALFGRFGRSYGQEFWALRDVSLTVRRGESLGIIGRNGSGKSTLLQILAGVLTPTSGDVRVKGRVDALLELGAGFNPEFTGRENVFLKGAILGLTRREIEHRFDEIAAFADIGEFIDQPVKLYSSGMFVRLAFAVTTALDADVLLIDEALAVGDVFFRQKCYRRLEALRDRGVSIVLVSHSMTDVEQFCRRALLLHRGEVVFQGAAPEAVKRYYLIEQEDRLAALATQLGQPAPPPTPEPPPVGAHLWPGPDAFLDISGTAQVSNGWARCTGVALCNSHGQPCRVFQQGETASFLYEFELLQDIDVPVGGIVIRNDRGVHVHGKSTLEYGTDVPARVCRGSRLRLRQDITLEVGVGEYSFRVGLAAIGRDHYQRRQAYSHIDLSANVVRLCHLDLGTPLAVTFRTAGEPVQLLHHGVANLPGTCRLAVVPPTAVAAPPTAPPNGLTAVSL
jgi:lipopolysaccharide transport system ATP-binding protein